MRSQSDIPARRGKIIALALALTLFVLAVQAMGQARRGARVVVTAKDGGQSEGELIAVKPASILLLGPSGQDLSLDVADVHSVMVFRKSKAGPGAIMGILAGVAGGYAGGTLYARARGYCPDCEAPLYGYGMGLLGGLVGLFGGLAVGASAGSDLIIHLGDQTAPTLINSLQKLRKYARIQAYR